jgi:hypothetical protein
MINKLLHEQEEDEEEEGHLHHLYDRKRTYTSDKRSTMSYDDAATIADETDVTTMQV